ncbi:MAG TPA: hypothetical protein VM537_08630 [Anaerolineae bacterium]|nr:hypothetical protein [Anaerolineae bacterium]
MATHDTVKKALALLSAVWPRQELSALTPEVYEKTLADVPDDLLEEATLAAAAEETFWPVPAAIRAKALELLARRAGIPTPHEAWGEVIHAMRACRPNQRPWSHEVVKLAVQDMGGLHLLGVVDEADANISRAQFVAAYNGRLSRWRHEATRQLGAGEPVKELEAG